MFTKKKKKNKKKIFEKKIGSKVQKKKASLVFDRSL
jgi:hypothetical protein